MTSIYFDHAATSPMSPEALQAYIEAASAGPGNPSSLHAQGRAARAWVTASRDLLASVLNCSSSELIFTGSGTESDNMALFGAAYAQLAKGRKGIVTSAVEHHAVLHACYQLEKQGFELTILPVDEYGTVSLDSARAAITQSTAVVSLMAGNNETGTLQPISEIGEWARKQGATMHVDAVQAFGYIPFNLKEMPVDMLSLSAHKINGPQGVGLLYVRKTTPFQPLLFGGSQERNRRAGTENVAGIVAFAKAAEIACSLLQSRVDHAREIRDTLLHALMEEHGQENMVVNGHPESHLPHILNVSFLGVSTESMLMNLDLAGVSASGGSACTSGSIKPSHVLSAMKINSKRIQSAVRFSFGLGNTREEAYKLAKITATISAKIRNR